MGGAVAEEIAEDGATITEVLERFERDGYSGQFRALDGARLQCITCRHELDAKNVELERLCRLEGASDPADMLAVVALRCPSCQTRGTAVLNYGPEATADDADVLLALDDERWRAPGE
jgi:hypothetical protein